MRTLRKTGVTVLTAGIALAIGAVPVALTVPSILASSESVTTLTPGAVHRGQGRPFDDDRQGDRHVRRAGTDVHRRPAVRSHARQRKRPAPCDHRLDRPRRQSGRAGFDKGNIGVFETGDGGSGPINASQCSRVDSGSFTTTESLNIRLDPAGPYSDAPFADRLARGKRDCGREGRQHAQRLDHHRIPRFSRQADQGLGRQPDHEDRRLGRTRRPVSRSSCRRSP